MPRTLRNRIVYLLTLITVAVGIITCADSAPDGGGSNAGQDQTLQIWWQQGFYPEESEAIQTLVKRWEEDFCQREGIDPCEQQARLTLFSDKDIARETNDALAVGNPPAILFNPSIDLTLIPEWAWDGRLADLSDVIDEDQFNPGPLETVKYRNKDLGANSYYAIPLGQQTANIHYWKQIEEAEIAADQIPQGWGEFWDFWKQTQDTLASDIKGIGLPMGPTANDTFFIFEQFLEAYGVELVDASGQLRVDEPAVRQGVEDALTEYAGFYPTYVPENAVEWENPDNNVAFLSQTSVMTVNPSLSIPGSQKQDEETYFERMITVPWPETVDGGEQRYLAGVKQIIAFEEVADGPKQAAKDFLRFFTQPDNMNEYLTKSQGRFLPVLKDLNQLADQGAFWQNSDDPHIQVALEQARSTRPFPQSYNPAYTQVQQENVWGIAIDEIARQIASPTEATDKALDRIEAIFAEEKWQ